MKSQVNPLILQLSHPQFSRVAAKIRANVDRITLEWVAEIRRAMPQMEHLTFDQLKDSTPQILHAIADAMESDDPEVIAELVMRAPAQGLSRFKLHWDVAEVMQEDRLLRSITVRHVESALGRQMDVPESSALHTAIDVMLQGSVIALVDQQKAQLRDAANVEMKFLSYLSHDLNNNLSSVTMSLHLLGNHLKLTGEHEAHSNSLTQAQKTIHATVSGMRQMLTYEQLRTSGQMPTLLPVDLHAVAIGVVGQFSPQAWETGIHLSIELQPGTVVQSDEKLLSIVLQNLVGNAMKFSTDGTVRIGCTELDDEGVSLFVSDDGPGIAPDKTGDIFGEFNRGDTHGQQGLGLGLAIASKAAKLLRTELTLETQLGRGSKFSLRPLQRVI